MGHPAIADLIRRTWCPAWKPPPRLAVSEWAGRYRYLSAESSAEPGLWSNARAPHLVMPMDLLSPYSDTDRVVLKSSSQVGKALALDTPIPTPNGWTTMGALAVGDWVFDEQGKPVQVIFATDVQLDRECYRVDFSDGGSIVADADHRWYVEYEHQPINIGKAYQKKENPSVLDTRTIAKHWSSIVAGRPRNRFAIPVAKPLDLPDATLPIDPYLLGVWLGDGCSHRAAISVGHQDIEFMSEELKGIDNRFRVIKYKSAYELRYAWDLATPEGQCIRGHVLSDAGLTKQAHGRKCAECQRQHCNVSQRPHKHVMDPVIYPSLGSVLTDLGLMGKMNKTIPSAYLRGSYAQRMALVQGLMDTDGTVSTSGRCSFLSINRALTESLAELLRTVGLKPGSIKIKHPRTTYKGDLVYGKVAYLLDFIAYDDTPVFRLPRKFARQKSRLGCRVSETERRRITQVEPMPSVPVRCIQVDSKSHMYLAGTNMIPTHNTEIILNFIGYIADLDPGPILAIQPNVTPMGEAFSKDRVKPMFRDSPTLAAKIGGARGRTINQTITHLTFPSGHLTIAGANSPAGLASRPIRYLVCDELDRWEMTKEGDPLLLARKRLQTFRARRAAKELIVSTPTYGDIGICAEYDRCTQAWQWHLTCQHCGVTQFPKLDHFAHKDDPHALRYVCAACGAEHPITDEDTLKASGQWVCVKDGPPDSVGFWINQWASPFARWGDTLAEWLDAGTDPARRQAVVNTVFAEPWEGEGEKIEPHHLSQRAEEWGDAIPDAVQAITIGVDCQGDRLECEIIGWGLRYESWSLAYEVLPGEPTGSEVWEDLLDLYRQPWTKADGSTLRPVALCVDAGAFTQHVYAFVKRSKDRGIIPIKGVGGMERDALSGDHRQRLKRVAQRLRDGRPCEILGVDGIKRTIFNYLSAPPNAVGYCHFPKGRSEEYYLQLTGERLMVQLHRGKRPERRWVPIHPAVEALDARAYGYAALLLSRVDLHTPRPVSVTPPPDPAVPVATPPPSRERQSRRRGGFVNSWR